MFLIDEAYSREVKALVSAATPVDMAIAFWGRGAQDLITASPGGRRRIVCNLVSGGTNPMVIRALLSATDIDVRQDESLHAKVLLGAGHGIVGSANFSANGLGFESDDRGSWIEAGYLLRDHTHLTEARQWFERLWTSAQEITEDMLVAAEENWRRNRARRPKPLGDQFNIRPDIWRDYLHRGIQIIIWRRRPSAEENARANHDRAQRDRVMTESSGGGDGRQLALDYYHGWPQGALSNLEATYIDVQYQQNGNVVCYGARRPMANGHTSWGAKDGGGSMDAMEKVRTIEDQRFGEEERRAFAQWIRPLLQQHFVDWAPAQGEEPETGGLVLHLDKALEAAFVTNDERFQWLLQCCEIISEGLGLRSVKVDTLVPQARIGLGERNLTWKEQRALKRVSMLLWISGSNVVCGSFLSKSAAAQFGKPVDRKGKAGRSWIQWPMEETAKILPGLVVAATTPFMARAGVHPSEDLLRKWPARELVMNMELPKYRGT